MVWFEVSIILVLVILNGLFSMSELAVVSARKARLESDSKEGKTGAGAALELANSPHTFLSTVQIGITLIGILAGVYGGASLGKTFAEALSFVPGLGRYSEPLSYALVVALITYLSLVVGELLPKKLALTYPEAIARMVSRPMQSLSSGFSPLVRVLETSTEILFRALPLSPARDEGVTEEEIKVIIAQGRETGTIERTEEQIVSKVLLMGDRSAASVMTPRNELIWIDVTKDPKEIWKEVVTSPHSYFPAGEGTVEELLGVISIKDLALHIMEDRDESLRAIVRDTVNVPSSVTALRVLELLKEKKHHIAIAIDEYGGVDGLITVHDLLEAMVGGLSEEGSHEEEYILREDGSLLISGSLDIHEVSRLVERDLSVEGEHLGYHSLAGFVTAQFGHIPKEGERFVYENLTFEVVDMDRNRVDKILVYKAGAGSGDEA